LAGRDPVLVQIEHALTGEQHEAKAAPVHARRRAVFERFEQLRLRQLGSKLGANRFRVEDAKPGPDRLVDAEALWAPFLGGGMPAVVDLAAGITHKVVEEFGFDEERRELSAGASSYGRPLPPSACAFA